MQHGHVNVKEYSSIYLWNASCYKQKRKQKHILEVVLGAEIYAFV
jgi:hypothetical protein